MIIINHFILFRSSKNGSLMEKDMAIKRKMVH
jgi:hypothetical protein